MGRKLARMIAGLGAFMDGYSRGQSMGLKINEEGRNAEVRNEIAATDENFTPRQTQVAAGDEALAAGQQAHQDALKSAVSEEEIAAVDSNFKPTLDALRKDQSRPASVAYSMGTGGAFKQQDAPFSTGDVEGAKARERASIYQRAGREDDAARVLLNTSRSRELADQDAVRGAMAGGTPDRNAAIMTTGATDLADVGSFGGGGTLPRSSTAEDPRLSQVKTGMSGPLDRESTDAYRQRKAPQVIDTYLKQGNLEGAKRYRDFIDSESGRAYVQDWSKGVRKLMIGDHNGAIATWQDLYNRQLYDDGNTVKLTPTEDGKQVQANFFDKAGKQVHSVTKPIDAFAKQAGYAMAPERLVEFQAQQEGKRTAEAASLDKATELENLRQQGQETRDDRRDERLATRIGADAARRASGGSLTPAQQRSNFEIDAAREAVAGLSPQDIARRTAKATNTGRENPDFDPGLARQAALAGRRKVGDDELFDSPKPKPAAPAFDRSDVAKRFRADKTMLNRTLGKDTQHGVEVLQNGKLIGYFQ